MRNPSIFLVSSLFIVIFLLLIPQGFCVEIIGGKEVVPHSRPYMVLIKMGKKQICAGALIDKNWVLTAAHCTVNSKSQVLLGVHDQDKSEPGRHIRHAKKMILYPCYDPHTHEGDLQLLQLNKEVTTGKNINLLPLPKRGDDVKPNTVCRVAGWGSTQNRSPMSSTLREVNVTVIDRKICNDPKHYNYNPVIGLNMICAGNPKGGKDSCNGDSGSPLICDGSFKGITAFGMEGKCGTPQGPGIYTLLSKKYLDWINKTMAGAV
ncbi:granzyme A isoform X1 [Sorex fumeus]|uniref:granzyme A isoform X1 n=1 Tax=Sorex fumeus TaxID=62283 RepID=UPI0024ADC6FB|nr:granzyme A isoform X1 [Sorex fumeus]